MRRIWLLAGAAALAATLPAIAQDQGRGRGEGQAQGQGKGQGEGQGKGKAQGQRQGADAARQGGGQAKGREDDSGRDRAQRARPEAQREGQAGRAVGQERRAAEAAREAGRRQQDRTRDRGRGEERQVAREDRRDWRAWSERRLVRRDGPGADRVDFRDLRTRGRAVGPEGCPPGLARQNAWCMPPGQLRQARFIGQRLPIAELPYNVPDRYRYRFADDDRFIYRYDEGAVYRFERGSGLVSSVIPILSAGLLPGGPLPLGYDVYNVPLAYRSSYPDSDDYLYRYDDNAIYRVDPDNRMVDGIVALLTGAGGLGGLGIGDSLPAGYDVYNVPLDHRDTYSDRDDALYRYADGNVYQVDPQTRLIEEVISLLV
jgi:hypothetical protein